MWIISKHRFTKPYSKKMSKQRQVSETSSVNVITSFNEMPSMPSYCTDIYGKFNVSAAFPKIWFSISERGMIIQITLVECNWGTDLKIIFIAFAATHAWRVEIITWVWWNYIKAFETKFILPWTERHNFFQLEENVHEEDLNFLYSI